jgi:hypothetical protein
VDDLSWPNERKANRKRTKKTGTTAANVPKKVTQIARKVAEIVEEKTKKLVEKSAIIKQRRRRPPQPRQWLHKFVPIMGWMPNYRKILMRRVCPPRIINPTFRLASIFLCGSLCRIDRSRLLNPNWSILLNFPQNAHFLKILCVGFPKFCPYFI